MEDFVVRSVGGSELRGSLRLLEGLFREGARVTREFEESLRSAVEGGGLEVISAFVDDEAIGVLVLAFRPSVSLGGMFASVEDLYVEPEHRERGIGESLIREAERRCELRGVSYLEAQVESDARPFYEMSGFESEDVRVMSKSLVLGGDQNSSTS